MNEYENINNPPAGLRITVEWIYPTTAPQMLALNTSNRNPKPGAVRAFADDMLADVWAFTGDAIKFSEDPITGKEVLIDGQNRLLACVMANKRFRTVVMRGLHPKAKEFLDTGSKRTFADVLKMRGVNNASTLGAAVGFLARLDDGLKKTKNPSHKALSDVYAAHPGLDQSASRASAIHRAIPGRLSRAGVAFLHYCFTSASHNLEQEDAAEIFFSQLGSVTGHEEGSPITALRKYMEADQRNKVNKNPAISLAVTIKAWNKWMAGETCSKLKWTPGGPAAEKFPEIYGF